MTRGGFGEARPYREYPYRDVPYLLNSHPGPLHHAPLAFAHRGADPQRENTLAAFRYAVELGYRYLEIDVRTSADGKLVIFHDETLDRITDGTGPLSGKTWEELSQLRVLGAAVGGPARRTAAGEYTDTRHESSPRRIANPASDAAGEEQVAAESAGAAGEPLMLFEEALATFPQVYFNVDLKDAEAVEPFAELVEAYDAHDRVLAASFNDARQRGLRALLSRPIATSGGWVSTALIVLLGPLGIIRRLGRRLTQIDCVQVPIQQGRIRVVTEKFIERCHRAGLQVHVWVVDDPDQMHQLLDMGVDGLMTDDARALAEVMQQRSIWPQHPQSD